MFWKTSVKLAWKDLEAAVFLQILRYGIKENTIGLKWDLRNNFWEYKLAARIINCKIYTPKALVKNVADKGITMNWYYFELNWNHLMTLFCFIYFNTFCEFSISEERNQAATVLVAMASRKELCLVRAMYQVTMTLLLSIHCYYKIKVR